VLEHERALGGRELGAAEGHVHPLDVDGQPLVHVDHRGERVPLGGQLDVVRDANVIVAVAAIETAEPLEIRAERHGVEIGQAAPGGEPGPGLGRHHVPQVGRADRSRPPEPHRTELPLACGIEGIELHGPEG